MIAPIGLIMVGLVCLVAGGEVLVRGASRLAAGVGIPPLVIGLTVVAFGTSAPELAVSIKASLNGQTDIAVGNVVGSNIFNVLFILGISALIAPLVVSSKLIRIDVPLMIVASVAVLLFGLDGVIGRIEGAGLFAGLVAFMAWTIIEVRRENRDTDRGGDPESVETPKLTGRGITLQVLLIAGGLVLLTFGSRWLVDGAVAIARLAGMNELLIGLTIVAAGTSLPEVATSVLASVRGEREIAVGNVVGSNIFNILCVLGLSAAIVPDGVPVSEAALRLDIPVMIGVAIACLPIFFTGHTIARWEGGVFLGCYIAYTTWLLLAATIPTISRTFGFVMLVFVVPLLVVTFAVGIVRSMRDGNPQR